MATNTNKIPLTLEEKNNPIKIKLAVDRSRNRVLFVDAGSDFVDVLLSFLTLPLSAIQFCAGASSPGCLSSLCQSVSHLRESKLLKVDACHGMLLCPRHVKEFNICNMADRNPCYYYKRELVMNEPSLQAHNQHCNCWEVMGRLVHVYNQAAGSSFSEQMQGLPRFCYNELFLARMERFVISDDWVIKPASTSSILSLLQRSGTDGIGKGFEEVEVIVSWAQVVSMLKASISSKTVFSDAFLSNEANRIARISLNTSTIQQVLHHPCEKESDSLPQFIIKLFFDKNEKKVMYAECNHEFVDLLFSVLIYPVNCAIKYMGGKSCLLSNFQNLYSSAIDLDATGFLTGSEFAKKMLLDPSLAPFRAGSRKENSDPKFLNDLFSEKLEFTMDRMYVVEDGLLIYQASAMSIMKHWCNKDKDMVVEMDVTMNKQEAVALVRAVVASKTVLTDVFKSRMEEA